MLCTNTVGIQHIHKNVSVVPIVTNFYQTPLIHVLIGNYRYRTFYLIKTINNVVLNYVSNYKSGQHKDVSSVPDMKSVEPKVV